jgi:group I intron endonuclease
VASKSGIYIITNTLNNKVYIGQSTNINKRITEHTRKLASGNHENSCLQNAYNKYGKNTITINPLIYCSINDLDFYEIRLISLYKSTNRDYGYNFESGGSLNKVLSEETKKKISSSLTGKPSMSATKFKPGTVAWNKGLKTNKKSWNALPSDKVKSVIDNWNIFKITQTDLGNMLGIDQTTVSIILKRSKS